MNQPNNSPAGNPNKGDETVALNLAPFAPGHKPAPAPTPAPDESVSLLVERAAGEVAGEGSQPVQAPKGAIPPKEMLGAVAYSYVKGVYRSEDIARKMAKDPEFNSAAEGNPPDAGLIRRFRRLNRVAIQETLAKVFRRQRKKAAAETMAQTMPGATPAPADPNRKSDPDHPGETTIISRRDAEEHLNKAAWIDNMSKDD